MAKARTADKLENEYCRHLRGFIRPFFYAKQGKRKTEAGRRVCSVTPEEWITHVHKAQCAIMPRGRVWWHLQGLDAKAAYQ